MCLVSLKFIVPRLRRFRWFYSLYIFSFLRWFTPHSPTFLFNFITFGLSYLHLPPGRLFRLVAKSQLTICTQIVLEIIPGHGVYTELAPKPLQSVVKCYLWHEDAVYSGNTYKSRPCRITTHLRLLLFVLCTFLRRWRIVLPVQMYVICSALRTKWVNISWFKITKINFKLNYSQMSFSLRVLKMFRTSTA